MPTAFNSEKKTYSIVRHMDMHTAFNNEEKTTV